ncbi:MAG TPA: hypothetical protein VHE30_27055 [Polyangiaceae bacterium]|nr:hypothetical protein [Polyangiaceae bacterium]
MSTGCGSAPPPRRVEAAAPHLNVCRVDETREYFCEDLLPYTTSNPAPAPYQSCPAVIDSPESVYYPPPEVGLFDTSYTEYTRKRAPPGHSCCYSWCSAVRLADPGAPSIRESCATPKAFREEFCMDEPEAGSRISVGPPFDRCPVAIVPPAGAVFSAPESAPFDAALSSAHRAKGQAHCCYSWCSQAPAGSGILKSTITQPSKK